MMKSEKFEKTKLRDFIYSNCQVRAIEKKKQASDDSYKLIIVTRILGSLEEKSLKVVLGNNELPIFTLSSTD